MKYTILINQKQVVDAGFVDSTDLVDWAIIDYISKLYASPKTKRLDDHAWVNLKHMIAEMPLLGLKSKQALSRRLVKQRDLGLITSVYDQQGRMYARITERCYSCMESDESVNPELTGCQRGVDGGVNSELTGCQRGVDIKQTINNKPLVIKKKEGSKKLTDEEMISGCDLKSVPVELVKTFADYRRKDINKPYQTVRGVQGLINILDKLETVELMKIEVNAAIDNEWQKPYPKTPSKKELMAGGNTPFQQISDDIDQYCGVSA